MKQITIERHSAVPYSGHISPLQPLPISDSGTHDLVFDLPPELEASEPPEVRGLRRDQVKLLVSYRSNDRIIHTRFDNLLPFLSAGDLLVINTSGTLNAAVHAIRDDGTLLELHLSTHLPGDIWTVEVREPFQGSTRPWRNGHAGELMALPNGGIATLLAPYVYDRTAIHPHDHGRLWLATLTLPESLLLYLETNGFPIRYPYVKQAWPASYYQTVYATDMGSAEMPSAGRAFTPDLITQLVAHGIEVAPLLLHTGVASLEEHEPPFEEFYKVGVETVRRVNAAHVAQRRVIAVGTTVVRALETVTDVDGMVHPGEGWTRLVITPDRGLRTVDGMLTGFHEPRATHLAMLQALVSLRHLRRTYGAALQERYLWHEFGDLHLILP